MRESWRLMEGFVAEEGKALLPHLAKTRPNLVENHMALVLAAFVSAGLLEVSGCPEPQLSWLGACSLRYGLQPHSKRESHPRLKFMVPQVLDSKQNVC